MKKRLRELERKEKEPDLLVGIRLTATHHEAASGRPSQRGQGVVLQNADLTPGSVQNSIYTHKH